jgi:hypothetical protein
MMKPRSFFLIIVILCSLLPGDAFTEENSKQKLLYKAVLGICLHDYGPASDRNETGVDPNLELQLNPPDWKAWRWLGNPYPTFGLTPNFNGDTSAFYAGLTYEFSLSNELLNKFTFNVTNNLFIAGGVGLAIHNGPLHKDEEDCEGRSDCGFGYRVLPRLAVELGYKIRENQGISFFYDHMSHRWILPGENEGIDHIGIRYYYIWDKPSAN